MRWRSRSMSSTLTCTVSPMERISLGWLTCDHDSSEMWIRPSMPSRSTNAPKSTMLEIWPSMMRPGCRRSRIAWRCSLRSSSSTARRESTTLLRERLSSMTLHSMFWPRYSSRFGTRRMSTSEAGRKPRTPRSMIRPPLTTSMTAPMTGSPDSAAASIRRQARSKRARFLDRISRPSWSSLVRTSASTSSPELDLVGGVDRLADRELVGGDDPLALVADVDEDLVLVDPDDVAGDDVALLEGDDRGVVVGDDLAVDLEQHPVGALDDPGVGGGFRRCHRGFHERRDTVASLPMPVRATKRGAERTPFALRRPFRRARLRRLLRRARGGARAARHARARTGARPLRDRRAPDLRVRRPDRSGCEPSASRPSIRQTFDSLVVHTRRRRARWPLPWTFSTFDYRELCELLWEQCGDAEFETAKVEGRSVSPSRPRAAPGDVTVHTDRGDLAGAPDRRRARLAPRARRGRQRPAARGAPLARPGGPPGAAPAPTSSCGSTRATSAPATAGRSPPRDELRIGVGSFDPRYHVKEPTVRLAGRRRGRAPCGYQGNWIPHQLRPATEDGVFFAGDSAGHCLPLTAEGIRTALYFGIACGRELRAVLEGRQDARDRAAPLRRLLRRRTRGSSRWMLRTQQSRAAPPRPRLRHADPAPLPPARCALGVRPLPPHRTARVRGSGARRRPHRSRATPRRRLDAYQGAVSALFLVRP